MDNHHQTRRATIVEDSAAQVLPPVAAAVSAWRPTRKMFVPSVPLVPPRPLAAVLPPHPPNHRAASPKGSRSSVGGVDQTAAFATRQLPGIDQTTRASIKTLRVKEMLLTESRAAELGAAVDAITKLLPSDDAAPLCAVAHTAREARLSARLSGFDGLRSSGGTLPAAAIKAGTPRHELALRARRQHLARTHREVEHASLVAAHSCAVEADREREPVPRALLSSAATVEAPTMLPQLAQRYVNRTAMLGDQLVRHANDIVAYTFSLMDATQRRVRNRTDDSALSFRAARQVQLVNVLRRDRTAEQPLAPPPAIVLLGGDDDRNAALQARLRHELQHDAPQPDGNGATEDNDEDDEDDDALFAV